MKSVPESEIWIWGTGGFTCSNPGRAWSSPPSCRLADFPRSRGSFPSVPHSGFCDPFGSTPESRILSKQATIKMVKSLKRSRHRIWNQAQQPQFAQSECSVSPFNPSYWSQSFKIRTSFIWPQDSPKVVRKCSCWVLQSASLAEKCWGKCFPFLRALLFCSASPTSRSNSPETLNCSSPERRLNMLTSHPAGWRDCRWVRKLGRS